MPESHSGAHGRNREHNQTGRGVWGICDAAPTPAARDSYPTVTATAMSIVALAIMRAAAAHSSAHQRERARWWRCMAAGETITCPRCGHPILPGQRWDLGHNDARDAWTGPEHAHCNRAAGAANSSHMREHWNKT